MLNITDLIREGQLFHEDYSSRTEYFNDISSRLYDLEIVTKDFKEALEIRELSYPTGLITKSLTVALPHVDSKYVKKNAVYITCFKTPVTFHRMDDVRSEVPVSISFLMLIKDVDSHMKAIQQIAIILQDEDILEGIYEAKDKDEVIALIEGKFQWNE